MSQVIKSIAEKPSKTPVAEKKIDGLGYLLSVISESSPIRNDYSTFDSTFRNEHFCFFHVSGASGKDEMILKDHNGGRDFIWTTPSAITGIIPESNIETVASSVDSISFSEPFEFSQKHAVRHIFYHFFLMKMLGPMTLLC